MMVEMAALSDSAERAAEFLRAVAHPGRLRIICTLMGGEYSAGELARRSQMSATGLSQHAAVLEKGGLIARHREARSIVYRLIAPEAKPLAKLLHELFCKPPPASGERREQKELGARR